MSTKDTSVKLDQASLEQLAQDLANHNLDYRNITDEVCLVVAYGEGNDYTWVCDKYVVDGDSGYIQEVVAQGEGVIDQEAVEDITLANSAEVERVMDELDQVQEEMDTITVELGTVRRTARKDYVRRDTHNQTARNLEDALASLRYKHNDLMKQL